MRRFIRAVLVVLSVTVVLSLIANAASANHLSSSTRTTRSTWTSLEFVEPLGSTFRCSLTLEGSLHSATISKTPELLVGFITRASVARPCTGGEATVLLATLPWHLRYVGFTGILPNITSFILNMIGFALRWQGSFGNCLFRSTATQPFRMRYGLNGSHAVASAEASGEIVSSEGCGPFGETITGRLKGTSATNTAQTITLI